MWLSAVLLSRCLRRADSRLKSSPSNHPYKLTVNALLKNITPTICKTEQLITVLTMFIAIILTNSYKFKFNVGIFYVYHTSLSRYSRPNDCYFCNQVLHLKGLFGIVNLRTTAGEITKLLKPCTLRKLVNSRLS